MISQTVPCPSNSPPIKSIFPVWREVFWGGQCQRPYWNPDRLQWLSLVHQCSYSIKEDHFGQAGPPLGEIRLVILCHVCLFHVPYHSFQEDLFHDLSHHRSEADRSVVPCVVFSTLLKNVLPFFHSLGSDESNHCAFLILSRGTWWIHQAVTSGLWDASYWDFWIFRFLRWSWTQSLLTADGAPFDPFTQEVFEEHLLSEDWSKNLFNWSLD